MATREINTKTILATIDELSDESVARLVEEAESLLDEQQEESEED